MLGCDQSNAMGPEDAVIYIGSGRFHPLGIARATGKRVYTVNPLSHAFSSIDDKDIARIEGRRKGAIAKALESETFGIMVSTKTGQKRLQLAVRLKALLESHGKAAVLLAANELSPPNLAPITVDMLVNTACPRIEQDEYHVPVIGASDLESALALLG